MRNAGEMYDHIHSCLVLLVLAGSLLGRGTGEEYVRTLTETNFDEAVSLHRVVLVLFTIPKCYGCQLLELDLEEAAQLLHSSDPSILLAKLDAETEKGLADRFFVVNYPTLKLFVDGFPHDFTGNSSVEGIVELMQHVASEEWKPPPNNVIHLSASNFTDTINHADLILVNFYSPDCTQCSINAPEFQKAANDLVPLGILLATVDGATENELARQYDITSFPTLKMFRKGKVFDYTGPMNQRGMWIYMTTQARPPSQELMTRDELESFVKQQYYPFVIAFPQSYNNFFDNYISLAHRGSDGPIKFCHSFNSKLAAKYHLKQDTIAVLRPDIIQSKYEPMVDEFKMDLEDDVAAFTELAEFTKPIIGLQTPRNQMWFPYPLMVLYLPVEDSTERGEYKYWRNALLEVAREYRGKLTFTIALETDYGQELAKLDMTDWGESVLAVLWAGPTERYRYEDSFSINGLTQFIEDYFEGTLEPYVRSRPEPKQRGPVTIVVGSTFKKIVLDPKKDVLVMIHAPRCPDCEKLDAVYQKLASKHKTNKDLVFAKFDAWLNEAPSEFAVTRFPTLVFVGAGESSKPVWYDGELRFEDIEDFINKLLLSAKRDEL